MLRVFLSLLAEHGTGMKPYLVGNVDHRTSYTLSPIIAKVSCQKVFGLFTDFEWSEQKLGGKLLIMCRSSGKISMLLLAFILTNQDFPRPTSKFHVHQEMVTALHRDVCGFQCFPRSEELEIHSDYQQYVTGRPQELVKIFYLFTFA